MQATRAIIHLGNLRRNIGAAKRKAGPQVKICLPVKADAYGHGSVPIASCALEAGVEYLAVATVSEGRDLRAAGIKEPVLLFLPAFPEEIADLVSLDLIPLVSDTEYIDEIAVAAEQAKKKISVHLKLDTGMGRLGCLPDQVVPLASRILSHKYLELGGTATHLSVSDSFDPGDIAYTKEQLSKFRASLEIMEKAGINPGLVHAANSGALVFHEDSYFNMIRPGIFLYGYSPAMGLNDGLASEPVMELRSAVALIKKLKKGDSVSYGRTWTANEDTFIAVIPAGYADGLPWGLHNNHSVLIRGKACPLAGRICMDQFMVDLGPETDVKRWDEAVIFGSGFIDAATMAKKLKTIPYEITCGINKRVPRLYVDWSLK